MNRSEELEFAQQRSAQADLDERFKLDLCDYRDLQGDRHLYSPRTGSIAGLYSLQSTVR